MAGVKRPDFNHIMLYDAFTSGPPLMLESLGLAKRGEGVHFFAEGRSTPGGKLADQHERRRALVHHSGMYGIFPIIEAARQLRGEVRRPSGPERHAVARQRDGRRCSRRRERSCSPTNASASL